MLLGGPVQIHINNETLQADQVSAHVNRYQVLTLKCYSFPSSVLYLDTLVVHLLSFHFRLQRAISDFTV